MAPQQGAYPEELFKLGAGLPSFAEDGSAILEKNAGLSIKDREHHPDGRGLYCRHYL